MPADVLVWLLFPLWSHLLLCDPSCCSASLVVPLLLVRNSRAIWNYLIVFCCCKQVLYWWTLNTYTSLISYISQTCHNFYSILLCQLVGFCWSFLLEATKIKRREIIQHFQIAPEIDILFVAYHRTAKTGSSAPSIPKHFTSKYTHPKLHRPI